MPKHLVKHGKGLAIIIESPVLEQLQIDQSTPLEVSTDGSALIITPIRGQARRAAFDKALAKTNERFQGVLQHLAE